MKMPEARDESRPGPPGAAERKAGTALEKRDRSAPAMLTVPERLPASCATTRAVNPAAAHLHRSPCWYLLNRLPAPRVWTRERDFRGSLSPRIKLCVKTDCSGWRPAARTRGDWCISRCPAPPPRAAVFSYRSGDLVWRSCRWMILAGGWSLPGPQVHPVTSGAPHQGPAPNPTADACCSHVVQLVLLWK